MGDVLRVSFELPTVIFTVLIGVSAIVWIVSLAGFGDVDDAADGVLEDLLSPIGLANVPTNVLLSLFALFGWAVSALLHVYLLDAVSGTTAVAVGVGVIVGGVVAALAILRMLAPHLAGWFEPVLAHTATDLVGRTVEIRSARVTTASGYGDVIGPDGNVARVDVRLRHDRGDEGAFSVGDAALLIDFDASNNVYLVDELPPSLR